MLPSQVSGFYQERACWCLCPLQAPVGWGLPVGLTAHSGHRMREQRRRAAPQKATFLSPCHLLLSHDLEHSHNPRPEEDFPLGPREAARRLEEEMGADGVEDQPPRGGPAEACTQPSSPAASPLQTLNTSAISSNTASQFFISFFPDKIC